MGNFTFVPTPIEGLLMVETKQFRDQRGYFAETYQKEVFLANGINCDFIQDNESCSVKGVLRGLHFQKVHAQAKLVRCISGEIYDAAVDLRPSSPTYLKYFGTILTGENKRQLFIPKHFAHGFLVLSETAVFSYKCDDFYCPSDEGGLYYADQTIGIDWPVLDCPYILSEKDLRNPCLKS